jgi:hypothetical protein
MENSLLDSVKLIKDEELKKQLYNYLHSLDEKDKIALAIAKEHLGTSFNIERSNGFAEWQKKQ